MNNVQQQQEAMKGRLTEITVEAAVGGIHVKANAAREILDIAIDRTKVNTEDTEQLQDLLVAAVNKALEQATAAEKSEAQQMIASMLPGGLGGLSSLFGK